MAIVIEDPPKGDNNNNNNGGGSSSSSSSGSAQQNYVNSLKSLLQSLGIKLTGNLSHLISQAASKHWSQSTFMFYLRKTKEYKAAFPGIMNKDGTLKMSEAQYNNMVKQYNEVAGLYGLKLSADEQAALFEGDTSVQEYRVRAQAIRKMRDNKEYFKQFERVLKAKGFLKGNLTRKNMEDIVLGLADPQWYKAWQEASIRGQAVMSGLNFAKAGTHLQNKDLRLPKGALNVLKQSGLSGSQLAQAVDKLAQDFMSTLPLSQIYGEGLKKKDLAKAIVGGKGSAAIRFKINRMLQTDLAYEEEERAAANLYEQQPGTTTTYGGAHRQALSE